MARQKKWNSEAERLAAYRKRQAPEIPEVRGSGELDPDEDPLTPGERELLTASVQKGIEIPEVARLPTLPIPENPPDLEQYVAEAVAAARISASARYSDKAWIESAVSSAERYARWRHAGYVAGEISGL